jgi:hypothetical protein
MPSADNKLRTVVMLDDGEHSPYLGRRPRRQETIALPAEEARSYVHIDAAIFGQASVQAELEEACAAVMDAPPKDAAARRAAARYLGHTLKAFLMTARLERDDVGDVCGDSKAER